MDIEELVNWIPPEALTDGITRDGALEALADETVFTIITACDECGRPRTFAGTFADKMREMVAESQMEGRPPGSDPTTCYLCGGGSG